MSPTPTQLSSLLRFRLVDGAHQIIICFCMLSNREMDGFSCPYSPSGAVDLRFSLFIPNTYTPLPLKRVCVCLHWRSPRSGDQESDLRSTICGLMRDQPYISALLVRAERSAPLMLLLNLISEHRS